MRYLWSQAEDLLQHYDGSEPLTHIRARHFKQHPALGSRDRRLLSALLYAWYRCGKGLKWLREETDDSRKLLWQAALLLTQDNPQVARLLPEPWAPYLLEALPEKIAFLRRQGILFSPEDLLAFEPGFSAGMEKQEWLMSLLEQPRLFLRIRHSSDQIETRLRQQEIPFAWLGKHCLALPNGTSVEKLLPADSYLIQDASSQQTGLYFQPEDGQQWWDCCAGAGGKSLLLTDSGKKIKLTASDIRPAILQNLRRRFELYGLKSPRLLVVNAADNTDVAAKLTQEKFDGIICDAPCSGSGTWARTPEQLYFFQPESLKRYTERQEQILAQLPKHLKPGGRLIYITCSVFQDENENQVNHFLKNHALTLITSRLLNGISNQADSLYVAVMQA